MAGAGGGDKASEGFEVLPGPATRLAGPQVKAFPPHHEAEQPVLHVPVDPYELVGRSPARPSLDSRVRGGRTEPDGQGTLFPWTTAR